MRSGRLDRTISIERAVATISDTGDRATAWTNFATVRAELLASRMDETHEGYGLADSDSKTFRIRYLPGLSGADRIIFEGRAFNILTVEEIGRRRILEIRAVAKK